jgi:ribosome biogenesis GTPase / thiamine phosphate phosphatase
VPTGNSVSLTGAGRYLPRVSNDALVRLGYDDSMAAYLDGVGTPGRVARADRGACLVLTADGSVHADVPRGLETPPATGDWVALVDDTVAAVAPRRGAIVRADPSGAGAPQVLAAHVDLVFVVHGLDRPLRPGRIERSLVLAWEAGVEPMVVVTKMDLGDVGALLDELEAAAPGVAVHLTSATQGTGLDGLAAVLGGHRTAALLGESGAGKSTLVNLLAGGEVMATGAVRRGDAKGRHTTTARHLVPLPSGGVLLDTPGLRQLGLWSGEEGLAATFADIETLAAGCRFRDCAHTGEPGCAVAAAVADGRLSARRLAGFAKLRRELEHQAGVVSEHERREQGRQAQRAYRAAAEDKRRRR